MKTATQMKAPALKTVESDIIKSPVRRNGETGAIERKRNTRS